MTDIPKQAEERRMPPESQTCEHCCAPVAPWDRYCSEQCEKAAAFERKLP